MAPSAKRDYYDVLDVPRNAGQETIKAAYKKLAIAHHPDRNPDDPGAEERFKEASEAYSVLSDPDKRARYDRMGHGAFGTGGGGYEPVDLGSMAEILEGLLGDMFGGRQRSTGGRDLTYHLTVSFVEAASGADKTIEVRRPGLCANCGGSGGAPGAATSACHACHGRGQVRRQRGLFAGSQNCQVCRGTGKRADRRCTDCSGTGLVERPETMVVKVPPGVEDGAVRTVRGAGEEGHSKTGDLHVHVHVEPHPLFTRQGADVLCTVPVSFPQAALGDELEVPTLDGKVKMKLPAGTASGKVLRLRGKGIEVFGGAAKGDQLVHILIEVPKKVSRSQRTLLEQLARETGDEALPERHSFLDKLKTLFD